MPKTVSLQGNKAILQAQNRRSCASTSMNLSNNEKDLIVKDNKWSKQNIPGSGTNMGPPRITADADTKSVGENASTSTESKKTKFRRLGVQLQSVNNRHRCFRSITVSTQPRGTIRRIAATTCHCKQQHNTSKGGTLTQLHDASNSAVCTRDLDIQEDQCKCTIKLLPDFFTQDELAVSNTEGNFGKQPLDKTKLPTLKMLVLTTFPVRPEEEESKCWDL
ncbi:hypothetical protein P5673_026456 [Acropora cervicornis]|uniref:Uncharacterized protein n=1 Tax=Acropora cervicornis TaxID=6130 RepID=A0AAD9UWC2_ACRCE|nr:hypothetical protein P5673_026456 [Acropora cervicornis]